MKNTKEEASTQAEGPTTSLPPPKSPKIKPQQHPCVPHPLVLELHRLEEMLSDKLVSIKKYRA